MTQLPTQSPVVVQPKPNVYTVLLVAASLALLIGISVVLWKLMAPLPTGYGMTFSDLFEPLKQLPK